jgi:peptidoglycan/xylan/chitin deacetylase (PgdA/CDA1 family)
MIKRIFYGTLLFLALSSTAPAQILIEPHLTIKPGTHHGPRIALTFDACTGQVDKRILQTLIDNRIRSTIFVTARWLKRNPLAIAEIKLHPDLFEVENHGARHVPAVDVPMNVFGIAAAGSPAAVNAEVLGGTDAVVAAFGSKPKWFRGATGKYTVSSENQIRKLGLKIAGYSVLGDGGASYSSAKAAQVIGAARDGDVIVAHINQPNKPAGIGVVQGILKLKAEGFAFLTLEDGALPNLPAVP